LTVVNMSRNYFSFYVLPLTIGPSILLVGQALSSAHPAPAVAMRLAIVAFVAMMLVFAQANGRRRIQRRLDQLERTTEIVAMPSQSHSSAAAIGAA
jgi:hypothetical protein